MHHLLLLLLLEALREYEIKIRLETNTIETHMIEQPDGHLNVLGLASNYHQAFVLATLTAVHTHTDCTRFHDLYLARAHMSDFIDLAAPLADDASYKVIWNINLLCLELLRGIMRVRWLMRIGIGIRI